MSSAYHEFGVPRGLETVAACVWEHGPAAEHLQRIVPDGCVDIVWLAGRELVVAGADTAPRDVLLPAGARSTGIRLRTAAAGAVLGMDASVLRDRHTPLVDVWGQEGERLAVALASAPAGRRSAVLAAGVAGRKARPDALVDAAALLLGSPGARVAAVAGELGATERRLHRRTVAAVGYGPKVLARVARLRRLIALPGDEDLAARAVAAGYASQAHMGDEVRRLTGRTPVRFLEDAALTAI
jgi:AraC-like DNA-binding protein